MTRVYNVHDLVNLVISAARFPIAFAVEAELAQSHPFLTPWMSAGWHLHLRQPLLALSSEDK